MQYDNDNSVDYSVNTETNNSLIPETQKSYQEKAINIENLIEEETLDLENIIFKIIITIGQLMLIIPINI